MLVSVVLPAFNEENYIERCLDALSRQEHPEFDFETIVVDDGSTDQTASIAAGYRARVISGPRRGVAGARQTGFEAARGVIIASTDADSAPRPDWLHRLVGHLLTQPECVAVYGPIRLYDGKGYEDFLSYYLAGSYLYLNAVIQRPAFSGQNFAVWRHAWLEAGGFDTHWVSAEDLNLSLKLRRLGRVQFDWRAQVATSSRRVRMGYWPMLSHTVSNYVRVAWLNTTPLPFTDIR